jgi:hypothetical protein
MNFRDVEQLSAYLDGQLSSSDSARLQNRIASEPEMASTLESLRESRAILRRLPHRRAPRNFLLTPKMVGKKPPLPRSYPVFRFATVLATLLFVLSFASNQVGRLAASAPQVPYGIGGGGGSDVATEAPAMMEPAVESAPATEAPVATEPPVMQEATPTEMALAMPAPTEAPATKEQDRTMNEEPAASTPAEEPAPPLLSSWQVTFLIIAALGMLVMFLIQRFAARKWRSK